MVFASANGINGQGLCHSESSSIRSSMSQLSPSEPPVSNSYPIAIGLIPALTHQLSMVAQVVRDGANILLEPGAGVINQNGSISQNANSFGFALEHLQALGFNLNAVLQGSEARAYQIPVDGLKYGPDVYVDKAGQVIAEIQVKAGSSTYVQKVVDAGHYMQQIVTNVENGHIQGASTVIHADGVHSIPVSQAVTQMAATHPYATAILLEAAATVGEVAGAGVSGAIVMAAIQGVLKSIHQLGPVMRGEAIADWRLLRPILETALAGLQSGFIRGAAVKVLQRLMAGNPLAVLGVTLTAEAIPVLIQLLNDEMTLATALTQIGARMLTSGMITIMVLLFPPVGLALLSTAVLQAVWAELAPDWKAEFSTVVLATGRATAAGIGAAIQELYCQPLNWFGSSAAFAQASQAELTEMNALLDTLLE